MYKEVREEDIKLSARPGYSQHRDCKARQRFHYLRRESPHCCCWVFLYPQAETVNSACMMNQGGDGLRFVSSAFGLGDAAGRQLGNRARHPPPPLPSFTTTRHYHQDICSGCEKISARDFYFLSLYISAPHKEKSLPTALLLRIYHVLREQVPSRRRRRRNICRGGDLK